MGEKMVIPESEQKRFGKMLSAKANKYGMSATEYIREIWYQEQAPKLGKYVAVALVDELLKIAPRTETERRGVIRES